MQGGGRDVGEHLSVEALAHPETTRAVDLPDHGGPHLPPVAQGLDPLKVVGSHDGQHALLGLAGHDLERLHARLSPRNRTHVDIHADSASRRGLTGGARKAGAAEVLDPDHEPGVEEGQAGLDQPLLLEGVAHLHVGPLGLVLFIVAEPGRRQHAHTTDPVATGARSEEHGQVPCSRRPAQHEPVLGHDAQAEHVESQLAADGGHSHRVAV